MASPSSVGKPPTKTTITNYFQPVGPPDPPDVHGEVHDVEMTTGGHANSTQESPWMNLRFEFRPGTADRVNIFAVAKTVIERCSQVDKTLRFRTPRGTEFASVADLQSSAFKEELMVVTTSGKIPTVLFGLAILTKQSFSHFKTQLGYEWLRSHNLFLRFHSLDFQYGVDLVLLGYVLYDHPHTANYTSIAMRINEGLEAVLGLEGATEEDQHMLDEVNKLCVQPEAFNLPIAFSRGTELDETDNQVEILRAAVPRQFLSVAKYLLQKAIKATNTLPDFLPVALKKENANLFKQWMTRQALYLTNHRNIQINITQENFERAYSDKLSFCERLREDSAIKRIYPYFQLNCIKISTTAEVYLPLCDRLDNLLKSYNGQRRVRTSPYKRRTPFPRTTYADTFSLPSTSNGPPPKTSATSYTNPWRKSKSIKIFSDASLEDFPKLPSSPSTDNSSSNTTSTATIPTSPGATSSTISTLSSFQAKLDEAVRKQQQAEQTFQSFQDAINQKLDTLTQQLKILQDALTKIIDHNLQSSPVSSQLNSVQESVHAVKNHVQAIQQSVTQAPSSNEVVAQCTIDESDSSSDKSPRPSAHETPPRPKKLPKHNNPSSSHIPDMMDAESEVN